MKRLSNNDAELKKVLLIKKRAIQYVEFNGGVQFFCFRQEILFFPKFLPTIKILILSWNLVLWLIRIWKFDTHANWNMQNLMMVFTFSVLDRKYPICAIWSKKRKLTAEIWYIDYFELAEYNCGAYLFCLWS